MEKKKGFRRALHAQKQNIWFLINMFFTLMYLCWRIFFSIPFGYGVISVVAGIALLIVEMLGMVEAFVHYANMCVIKEYPLPVVPEELYPHVDVFVPTYSEGTDILYKTLNACKHLRYPDKSKVHIYLCDDNRRPEMRQLAAQMGVHYLDRPDNTGAKAGNLNNAMRHSNSPYIVTIDADMLLKSDFLLKTMPYMVESDIKNKGLPEEDRIRLGFIQTPQSFYNLDLFQFNLFSEERIPNEQDYFYRNIQVARTRSNSVIYGGSNTLIRREALEAVGGFYTETITEDFATGILIQKKQYVTLGLSEPMASGLSANDLQALIQQRVRWARGVIATGKKVRIFSSPELSFSQKMDYWASIWYWYAPLKRLIYIMSPILYATFGFMVFKCTLPQILLFWLPMYLSSNISLRMISNNIRTTKWTGIYETVLFPFMLLPVLAETAGITLKKFKVTEKGQASGRTGISRVYTIPFLILGVLSVIGILRCVWTMFDSGSFGPIVVLFWLINNLFFLVMSLFFVDGRIPHRKAERVRVALPCTASDGIAEVTGMTQDISETGLAMELTAPYYFGKEEGLTVRIVTEMYEAVLKAEVVYVFRTKEGRWRYALRILDTCGTYDDLLGILYDRIPTLPHALKKDSGSFEDLKLNTQKRTLPPFYQKRSLPRVVLDTLVPCKEAEEKVRVYDFNYQYLTVPKEVLLQQITLLPVKGLMLRCRREEEVRDGYVLYAIENIQQIWQETEQRELLLEWLTQEKEEKEPPTGATKPKDDVFEEMALLTSFDIR